MRVMFRLTVLPALLLLLGGASFALAESPLGEGDPVAPAVVGRPLPPLKPGAPARKPVAVKPAPPRHAARPAPAGKTVAQPAKAVATVAAPDSSAMRHPAKQALDDRADPRGVRDDVGKGSHFARKALEPGAYFGDRNRAAVRQYYRDHPVAGTAARWQIGEPVPSGAPLAAVPAGLMASLPRVPPGHRYVELGGEVVLIAEGSRMVVDGISRNPR